MRGVYISRSDSMTQVLNRDDPILEGPIAGDPHVPWGEVHLAGHIGPLVKNDGDEDPTPVYLYHVNPRMQCASQWTLYLPDRIWENGKTFYTSIRWSRLDFTDSIFNHRFNLATSDTKVGPLYKLAKAESKMWGVHAKGFVRFKNPQSQGYQGVYGVFGPRLAAAIRIAQYVTVPEWLSVYDTFSGKHLLEFG